jgi:hypothetical protein
MAGLIDAIINPAQTDVLGALDKGRERQATDMAGELLAQTLPGKVGDLARLSPDKALKFAELTGIPLTSEGRIKNLMGVNIMGAKLLQAGQTQEAMQFLSEEADKIESVTNEPATRLRTVIQAIESGDQETISNFTKSGLALDPSAPSALDQAKTSKFNAEAAALGGKGKHPKSIVKNLSAPIKQRAIEAFNLAGGGKDGVKAMNAQIELDRTTTQREDVPELLTASFPNANEAELQQLQATVDGSKSVDAGLKAADKVRSEQRRLVKAEIFQLRAVRLLDGILDNPELNDVLGAVEGTDKGFFFGKQNLSDGESTAIADIEEVSSILTADNLKLMSGVLSESDIKLLIALSAGSLNRTRGEARFIKDATELRDRLKSVLVQPLGGGDQTKKNRLEELRAKAGR